MCQARGRNLTAQPHVSRRITVGPVCPPGHAQSKSSSLLVAELNWYLEQAVHCNLLLPFILYVVMEIIVGGLGTSCFIEVDMLPLLINEGAGAWKDGMKSHDQLTVEPGVKLQSPFPTPLQAASGCQTPGVLLPFSFYRMLVIMTRFWRRHLLKYLLPPWHSKREDSLFHG